VINEEDDESLGDMEIEENTISLKEHHKTVVDFNAHSNSVILRSIN
jgi:hypothetical protein